MKSYLNGKRKKVKLYDFESDYQNIATGVPQGTVLGPILFMIYVNELLTDMVSGIVTYADDFAITSTDDKIESK